MPVRDLRVLDKAFLIEDSSNLLVREGCMVLSMEHVRIIITPDAVFAPVEADCSAREEKFHARLEAQALLYSQSGGSMEAPKGLTTCQSTASRLGGLGAYERDDCGVGMLAIPIPGSANDRSGRPRARGTYPPQAAHAAQRAGASSHPVHNAYQAGALDPQDDDWNGFCQLSPAASNHYEGTDSSKQGPSRPGSPAASVAGTDMSVPGTPKDIVPFETVILEAALDEVTRALMAEASELTDRAYPALDHLSRGSEIFSEDLQLIRLMKTQHQRLRTRVDVVNEELKELLEDDKDLQRMCLSTLQELYEASKEGGGLGTRLDASGNMPNHYFLSLPTQSVNVAATLPFHGESPHSSLSLHNFVRNRSLGAAHAASHTDDSSDDEDSVKGDAFELGKIPEEQERPRVSGLGSDHSGVSASAQRSRLQDLQARAAVDMLINADMEEMENLVESYCTQVGATSLKLRTLGQYIEDTEDFINLSMDAARNRLIKLEIVLTAATFALALWGVVAGVLGENMVIAPKFITKTTAGYIFVNIGMLILCSMLFGVIMWHARKRRLI